MIEKIVLTGAAGKIGRRMRRPLAQLCRQLVSTDIVPLTAVADNEVVTQIDLTDPAAVEALARGAHAIVHFAGYPREAGWDIIIPSNIVTATNLWEAAVKNGVGRVLYASTNHVVGFHPVDRHIGVNDEVKCDSRYGVSKAFTEVLARFYYEKYGIASLGVRIGRCEDRPTDERMLSTWIHPDDLASILALGLEHPIRSDLIYGISDNASAWCSNPRDGGLPYTARHRADDHPLDEQAQGTSANWRFQGGPFADQDYRGDPDRAALFYRCTPQSNPIDR
jgi:uronate dehydrogenase